MHLRGSKEDEKRAANEQTVGGMRNPRKSMQTVPGHTHAEAFREHELIFVVPWLMIMPTIGSDAIGVNELPGFDAIRDRIHVKTLTSNGKYYLSGRLGQRAGQHGTP